MEHLEWAGLIEYIYASSASGIPLSAQVKHSHLICCLDIGLFQRALQIDPDVVMKEDLVLISRGAIAEPFVGQELLALHRLTQRVSCFIGSGKKRRAMPKSITS